MTDPLDAKWRAFTRENIARNPDAPMAYGALLPVLDAWEAEVAALRDDSAATIDRWVDALATIAALRAALEPAQRLVDVIFAEAQAEPFILPLRGMRAAGDLRAALAAAKETP